MARGGSKPGERRGGRKRGVPNKSSLAKAAIIKRAYKKAGTPLAIERLAKGVDRYATLAETFDTKGATPNAEMWEHFYDKSMDLAKHVAPYQSAKLQSTTLVGDRDKPITHTLLVKYV